ncbi:WXG100 family type VII secretion target [Bifidobacterium mongoliense]|jgi:WXG100 family type VII secretion target|uniref:ESAT-6-like protein n=2 Tax=Bifidobacterium mongoliense TaxID=518643 RepID=A0A087CAA9_9BIFI|nr:WXG100 family type VII secretion target [Bifidobacterium mongoliense]KFI80209.1 type VII secretion protein [Bifidobacterium mongoliense DSM 21395]MDN5633424.1 WXG100 family type VII secretion target [Bifidobacterium mongoliense]MDN5979400.1 WXG100 family type VII secretion target [Bifidobacterium mongoliense]MDN6025886.1 WXG100 family type VII secretion target [Bifidobacterium mongoliense]MDN6051777.1 WXG100 family type VII secretion target [Bifidobacterium mongoliense]
MSQYQVDSERIMTASAAVSASVGTIREAVAGMYANLTSLQSVWTGGAATRFAGVSEQWRAAQLQMEQSLESIQLALSQASSVYTDAEVQASRLFAGS